VFDEADGFSVEDDVDESEPPFDVEEQVEEDDDF